MKTACWISLAVTVSALMGCMPVKQLDSVDGMDHYQVECDGRGLDWSDCRAKAVATCPNGRLVETTKVDAAATGFFNFHKYDRTMNFTCKP